MAKASAARAADEPKKPTGKRAAPLSQSDVPGYTLKEVMKIAEAIRDQFGKQPASPLDLAVALDLSPSGGYYKMLTGAAIAYGLTDGGAQASSVGLTALGRRVVAPTEEGDELAAMREAVLKPRVVREFLEKYNGSPLPTSRQIAMNVLEQMGVPGTSTDKAFDMIVKNAEEFGLVVDHKGKKYVRLGAPLTLAARDDEVVDGGDADVVEFPDVQSLGVATDHTASDETATTPAVVDDTINKVFITHGKNTKVVEQIRKILTFGKFEAIVSVDRQSTAKPVPEKVLDDMRNCGAAIVHVGAERRLMDGDGNEVTEINPNVLIEIGAAMALYGKKFVLLVERGVTLPSNLQGLYEVRYEGEQLDHEATMKLLEAFNDFR